MESIASAKVGVATEVNRDVTEIGLSSYQRWSALSVSPREFPPATPLFIQGNPPQEVFCIERGLIKLIHLSENGQELLVGLQSKGSLLGAASVIVRKPYPITAITVTNCALSRVPADLFLRLAKTDEQFCWYLQEIHSQAVHRQASQLAALRNLSARQRLERLLLQFLSSISRHEKQAAMKIRLPLKHWEIAQLIGITPEHLSRIIKQIKQEGLMHEQDGYMVFSDVRKLGSRHGCD